MSVEGRAAGFIATLYYVESPIASPSASTIAAAAIAANQVIDVADMGELTKERSVIDVPVYGQDTMGKLAGQADPGTFDFNVTMNFNDTIHQALRDDTGRIPHGWIIKFTQSAENVTYAYFEGAVSRASVGQPIDDRIQMDVSVARAGDVTWTAEA